MWEVSDVIAEDRGRHAGEGGGRDERFGGERRDV